MKNVKLCLVKKIFSVLTASSMMFGCRYISAMKPESNSLNLESLDLQEDYLNLVKIGMRCESILKRDDAFVNLIRQMFRDFFYKSIAKVKLIIGPDLNENTCKLIHGISESASLLNSSMLKFLMAHSLVFQSAMECFNTVSKEIESDRGIVSPNNIALVATTRCVTYSLVCKNLVKDLSVFISSIEKFAKLASTENLSSKVKKHINDLQKLINDNTHLLNQIKKLCK